MVERERRHAGHLVHGHHLVLVAEQDAKRVAAGKPRAGQVFEKGHQIRLTIGTADTPATATPVPDLVNELGTITILDDPEYPSNVRLPVIGA